MSRAQQRALLKTLRERRPQKIKRSSGKSGKHKTLFNSGEFIAIDGEGFSDGASFHIRMDASGNIYRGRKHFYAYLAASEGTEIYAPHGRLSMRSCLDFLCGLVERNPFSILVVFGGTYDVTQMLAHDLTRDQILNVLGKDEKPPKVFTEGGFQYQLEYRPRKCLTIRRWREGERRFDYDAKGRRRLTPHLTVKLWDVWGYFQDSFVNVINAWLPGDPDLEFIKRMKGERNIFQRSDIDEIRRYNAAELRCLVKVMNKVRDAIGDLGLTISRWDGAGAIASAMLKQHGVKEHVRQLEADIFNAARGAYSGGHIETIRLGYHAGPVFHYDINSAYPDQFRNLPSASVGAWKSGTGDPPSWEYSIIFIEYEFTPFLPFYPLFYREKNGGIIYPWRGSGWYWRSEYETALDFFRRFGGRKFHVKQWHAYDAAGYANPFSWI